MPSLNIPVSQPQSQQPPNVQGASGTGEAMPAQGGIPMAGGGQQMQPPSHHETVAILEHISAFDRKWREILANPEIGEESVKKHIYDAMADLMAEEYATLPQTMQLLKSVPDTPLEQKQWLEEHVANDQQAMGMILQHHAMNPMPLGTPDAPEQIGQPPSDRGSLVNSAIARYKKHGKKSAGAKGIPLRG